MSTLFHPMSTMFQPVSALCLPDHIAPRAEVLLGFIAQREVERRAEVLARALGFAEGLEIGRAITPAEHQELAALYCAADRRAYEVPA